MNTMRVFLHDLPWKQDPSGFRRRIDRFLSIADSHGIKPILVLFDSCWDPVSPTGAAARAQAGRAQFRLGAKPRSDVAQESRGL